MSRHLLYSSISGVEKLLEKTCKPLTTMKSVERSWTWGGGSGWGGQDSLYCPRSSHCFKLSPWSSPASLGIPHIHSSTPLFTSSRGKTSQTGLVSESLHSAWQLYAVGHGSHPPRAALSTRDRPVQSSMWRSQRRFQDSR